MGKISDNTHGWIFGYALLFVIFVLALCIGPFGNTDETHSFGLPFVLGSLGNLTGAWAGWKLAKRALDGAQQEELERKNSTTKQTSLVGVDWT